MFHFFRFKNAFRNAAARPVQRSNRLTHSLPLALSLSLAPSVVLFNSIFFHFRPIDSAYIPPFVALLR